MSAERRPGAARLARAIEAPPGDPTEAPDAMAILYGCEEPPPFPEGPDEFWALPETFRPAHRLLEETARDAGLGILALAERCDNWWAAVPKLKGVLDPHGVEFPRIPEIGIDGKTVAFDPEDIIPVFRPPPRREPSFALRPMPARRRRSRGGVF